MYHLVGRKCEDTGDIVVEEAVLLLAEVTNDVATVRVGGGHHVEEEGFHIVVERLVVEERLCDQTKVLAVLLVLLTTHLMIYTQWRKNKKTGFAKDHLKDGEFVFSVDLVPRWMFPNTLLCVSLHHTRCLMQFDIICICF